MNTEKTVGEKLENPWNAIPDTLILDTNKKGGAELAKWWVRILPRHHDIPLMKLPTRADVGKLNHFVALLGHSDAYATMKWAIEHWDDVEFDVKMLKARHAGKIPTIGALLMHADVVVKSMRDSRIVAQIVPLKGSSKLLTKAEMKAMMNS